jgi:hypothetical protein
MLNSWSTFVVAWTRPNTADGALSAIPLQKRARRNDPNSLKGMQCKQVRIAGHNVSRLSAYSERKKLVILRGTNNQVTDWKYPNTATTIAPNHGAAIYYWAINQWPDGT